MRQKRVKSGHSHPSRYGVEYSSAPVAPLKELQPALDEWLRLAAAGDIPRRSGLAFDKIDGFTQSMMLWEISSGPTGVWCNSRLRYIGSAIEVLLGARVEPGRFLIGDLDREFPKTAPMIAEMHGHIFRCRTPLHAFGESYPADGLSHFSMAWLAMPLSRDGSGVDFIVSLNRFYKPEK